MYKGLNNSFNLFVKYEVFAKVWVATVRHWSEIQ